MARNSGKKIKSARRSRYVAPRKTAAIADSNSDDAVPLRETIRLLMSNRSGFVGFILSVLQLLGHAPLSLVLRRRLGERLGLSYGHPGDDSLKVLRVHRTCFRY